MLSRLTIPGVELPRLYIAEDSEDAKIAKDKGLPFIKWKNGQDELIKCLLRPVLEKLFPYIKWNKVLGPKKPFRTNVFMYETENPETIELDKDSIVEDEYKTEARRIDADNEMADIAINKRTFDGVCNKTVVTQSLKKYIGDLSSQVNLDVLQELKLLPAFIGDICDCIKVNLIANVRWNEGYNKKHALTTGTYNRSMGLKNLIILDVSGSIPRGISATMISLIDTLRTQVDADLIITASVSRFYPMGTELPDPQEIRDSFGYGNESGGFNRILENYIEGNHYGHVISFGDNDNPGDTYPLKNTKVEHVHHYHTHQKDTFTGYAKWCHHLPGRKPVISYNTDWCSIIND